jgi:ribulose-phosphate 3-epimerase
MISDPLLYAQRFADAGAQRLSFHPEVVDDVGETIAAIRGTGVGVGLAIHPDIGLASVEQHLEELDVILVMTVRPGFGGQAFLGEVVPKIEEARRLVDRLELKAEVEVDGGVNLETLSQVVGAGAGIVVAGSAIFDGKDAPSAAARMRAQIELLEASP